MSYYTMAAMATNTSLTTRLIACAAAEGLEQPDMWVERNKWLLVSQPGWDSAFAYAEDNKTINVNQDSGMRDDVINDSMILAAVQAVIAETTPVVEE